MKNRDILCDLGFEESIVFDNPDFDEAIVGTDPDGRVVYDWNAMVRCLEEEGMTEEEAIEFISYNTIRALPYMGENAPIVLMNTEAFNETE